MRHHDLDANATIVLDSPTGDPMVTHPPAGDADATQLASAAPGALDARCAELTAQLRVLRDKCRLLEREAQYERERTREAEDSAAAADLAREDLDGVRDELDRVGCQLEAALRAKDQAQMSERMLKGKVKSRQEARAYNRPYFGSTSAHFVRYLGCMISPQSIRPGDTGRCDQNGLG